MKGFIPKHFIQSLTDICNIEDVVGNYVELSKKGAEYTGLCPFHNDRSPSFSVVPNKKFYYCFSCQAKGNVIDFLMNHTNVGFQEAVEIIADVAGVVVPYDKPDAHLVNKMNVSDVLDRCHRTYCEGGLLDARAKKLMDDLGVSESVMQSHGVGFSSNDKVSRVMNMDDTALIEAGIISKKGKHNEHWCMNKIVMPVRDKRGMLLGMISQPMNSARPSTSFKSSIFNPDTCLYGINHTVDVVRKTDTLVVLERPLDVLALHSNGIECCVSVVRNSMTIDGLKELFSMVSNVVFCFGRGSLKSDGFADTLKYALMSLSDCRDISFVILPNSSRSAAAYMKVHDADGFHTMVDRAIPVVDVLLRRLVATCIVDGDDKMAWLKKEGLVALSSVPAPLYRRLAIKRFETLLDNM